MLIRKNDLRRISTGPQTSLSDRALKWLVYTRIAMLLLPWILMAVGSIIVGLLALGPRKGDIPKLWICLPASITLIVLPIGLLHLALEPTAADDLEV